ncbi:MAG: 5'/3'-nucleotidase SurE [Acidobacteria bacterium]|nr:MAG: 5'/3'-nucleotidase SurE [Acidobacteriota bacterium]REK02091.1 MAG: 5'/3'-nucleotidase SurE [Acidobacteriota bacterium]REK15049.1 MAG: 5'/3'-nucleotidase SurE [Acidobacteriota bacterium]REK45763.1 MAG: 5'/3'-nucleotidase SurE [Acidobacteriota bacterium]
MTRRPRILITNDDGYHSEGINKLEESLSEIGDVYVVAPESEMSGASHSLTLARPLRIRQVDKTHWTVDGTPTDCVTLALNQILAPDLLPDICASGINPGANMGDDATYSGTIAGALEATILGVTGLAFSLVAYSNHDYTESAKVAYEMTKKALEEGLPKGTLLNVNIPKGVPKGFKITKQGFKNARPVITEHIDPRGKAYYWIGEVREGFHAEGGTDFEAIEEGFVSVTPMRSDLTNHDVIGDLKGWESQ